VKSIFAIFMLAAGLAMASRNGFAADVSANLRLMAFGSEAQLKAVKNAVGRFNQKYPNVKVEVAIDPISNGWGDYVTRVLSQFNANNAYDIYGTAIETFRTFETRNLFIPLDDYIAGHSSYSDFDPALFKYASYNGKTYFIPIGWNNIMINYNRKLFKDAGLEFPKTGWTWNDFREIAKKLTVRDAAGNVTQFGYEVPNQLFFLQPWFYSNGTSILNQDWTASNMLDPKVSESLQFLFDLIHVDKVSPIPGKDSMDNQFTAGQVAMISRGHWIVQNAMAAKLDMDIAIPPAKVNDYTVIGFGGYGVSRTSKNPDIAKELVGEPHKLRNTEGRGRKRRWRPRAQIDCRDTRLPCVPAERRAVLSDAAAHLARAVTCKLPGGREDLHPKLHCNDGGRDLYPGRREASRPGIERVV
jgi:multiple sugar transport system substrate-binding protein